MKDSTKKILIVAVIAVVLCGVIFAAGCTSTSSTQNTSIPVSDSQTTKVVQTTTDAGTKTTSTTTTQSTDSGQSTNTTTSVTKNTTTGGSEKVEGASVSAVRYLVSFTKAGTGSGTITSDYSGKYVVKNTEITFSAVPSAGSEVTGTPMVTPESGSAFAATLVSGNNWKFTMPASPVTVTVIFDNNNSYTVKFDANGGSGTMADQAFTIGTAQNLSKNTFTRTGYTFSGWATTASGAKVYDDEQSVTDLTTTAGATVTLYAVWTPKTYSITYKDQGDQEFTGTHDAGYPTTHTYGTATTLKGATKTNYTFDGWFADSGCTGTKLTQLGATSYTSDITLYAKWTEIPNSYTVKFDKNGGEGTMADQVFTIGVAKNLSKNTFTRTGYTFSGWATTAAGSVAYTDEQSVTDLTTTAGTTVTLYAVWTPVEYHIDYKGIDGATVEPANPTTYTIATPAFTLTNPVKGGVGFGGWTGNGISVPTTTMTVQAGTTGNLEFTAHWVPTKVTVTAGIGGELVDETGVFTTEDVFTTEENEGYLYAVDNMLVFNTTGVVEKEPADYVTAEPFASAGYQFGGWFFDGKKLTNVPLKITGVDNDVEARFVSESLVTISIITSNGTNVCVDGSQPSFPGLVNLPAGGYLYTDGTSLYYNSEAKIGEGAYEVAYLESPADFEHWVINDQVIEDFQFIPVYENFVLKANITPSEPALIAYADHADQEIVVSKVGLDNYPFTTNTVLTLKEDGKVYVQKTDGAKVDGYVEVAMNYSDYVHLGWKLKTASGDESLQYNTPVHIKEGWNELVAQVGYEVDDASELQNEITAGENVRLTDNVTMGQPLEVPSGTDVTIFLNGNNISYSGSVLVASAAANDNAVNDYTILVRHGATLTISGNGTVTGPSVAGGCAIKLTSADDTSSDVAKLIVNGGTIVGYDYGISGNGSEGRENTSVIINAGTIRATGHQDAGLTADGFAIYTPQYGSVEINGGSLEGTAAVYQKSGTLTINGGNFTSTLATAQTPKYNANGGYPTGDAVVIDNAAYPGGNVAEVTINGGNFIVTAEDAADVGYYETKAGRESVGISVADGIDVNAAAKIGNVYYATLSDAFLDVEEGETVVLNNDVTAATGFIVTSGQEFTLDLNGNTLTVTPVSTVGDDVDGAADNAIDYAIAVRHGGNLTITDSVGDGQIIGPQNVEASCAIKMTLKGDLSTDDAAILTVEDGKITGKDYGISGNGSEGRENTVVTINGGTVEATEGIAVYNPQNGKLTVTGGTLTGEAAIYQKSGSLSITGGNFESKLSTYMDPSYIGNGANPTGDAVVIDNAAYPGGNVTDVSITGGKFTTAAAGAMDVGYYETKAGKESVGISVADGISVHAVKVGDKYYATVADAVNAAESGATVKLTGDAVGQSEIIIGDGKTVTLDLNGFTLTAHKNPVTAVFAETEDVDGNSVDNDSIIVVMHGGNLTVTDTSEEKSGKILAAQEDGVNVAIKMTGKNDTTSTKQAVLTIENGYISGDDFAVSGNGSEGRGNTVVTINGGELVGSGDNDSSIGIYNPQNGQLIINGGKISGGDAVYQKSGSLTITGGELKGLMTTYATATYNGNGANPTGDAVVIDNAAYPGGNVSSVTIGEDVIFSEAAAATGAADIGYYTTKTSAGVIGIAVPAGVSVNAVAKVDGKYYATIQDAIDLGEGTSVEVVSPMIISGTQTLDLRGKTVASNTDGFAQNANGADADAVIVVKRGADLTISDSSDDEGAIIANGNGVNAAIKMTGVEDGETGDAAKLTVESGTIKGYYYAVSGNGNRQNTEIVINGGHLIGTAEDDSVGIYNPQSGKLTINGGIIEGATGVFVKCGTTTVVGADATIKGTGDKHDFKHNESGFNSTGDAFVIEVCDYPGTPATVDIQNGSFLSAKAQAVGSYVQQDDSAYSTKTFERRTGFITGGTFDTNPKTFLVNGEGTAIDLVASGYIAEKDESGKYVVKQSGTQLGAKAADKDKH